MSNEKEVLAEITDEEAVQFEVYATKRAAVLELQKQLVEEMAILKQKENDLFEMVREKYGVDGAYHVTPRDRKIYAGHV